MRSHKGSIQVTSKLGTGTTVAVLLPCTTEPSRTTSAKPSDSRPNPTPKAPVSSGCILLAEDDEGVRKTTADILDLEGFEVVTASNGLEAVNLFKAEPDRFKLVLMDLTMPGLDGEVAVAKMQELRPQVRVVLMSGFAESEVNKRLEGRTFAGFARKPFDYASSLQLINRAISED